MKLVFFLIPIIILIAILNWLFPDALLAEENRMNLIHSLLWLTLIGSAIMVHYRGKMSMAAKHILIWVAAALLLVLAYSYRFEVLEIKSRLLGELIPSRVSEHNGVLSVRAAANGHFYIDSYINGVPVRLMVDTGASDLMLDPDAARRVGFDLETLTFNKIYNTANGRVRGASVRLDSVKIGPIIMDDVRASVNGASLGNSLLGMSFLERLSGYEVSKGSLTLIP